MEETNCKDCDKYMDGESKNTPAYQECLSCGYAHARVDGYLSLIRLNESRDGYNCKYGYDEGDEEYLPELTLEEYKIIAAKHHRDGYHCDWQVCPELYHSYEKLKEPRWDYSS